MEITRCKPAGKPEGWYDATGTRYDPSYGSSAYVLTKREMILNNYVGGRPLLDDTCPQSRIEKLEAEIVREALANKENKEKAEKYDFMVSECLITADELKEMREKARVYDEMNVRCSDDLYKLIIEKDKLLISLKITLAEIQEKFKKISPLKCTCCERGDEYNGFGSGPTIFTCPKGCACHD